MLKKPPLRGAMLESRASAHSGNISTDFPKQPVKTRRSLSFGRSQQGCSAPKDDDEAKVMTSTTKWASIYLAKWATMVLKYVHST